MDKVAIVNKMTPVFRSVFEIDDLVLEESQSPKDIDKWDSMTHMMLIEELEKEFGIKFKLMDIDSLDNVGAIISTISSYINN